MSTYHAIVWMDHKQAHVVMFDREHIQTQRIKTRSHHKHQGKVGDTVPFFQDIAKALSGTHEVLLTGPGLARQEFRTWCQQHQSATAQLIVDQHCLRPPQRCATGGHGQTVLQEI